jgi:hypothetical protein
LRQHPDGGKGLGDGADAQQSALRINGAALFEIGKAKAFEPQDAIALHPDHYGTGGAVLFQQTGKLLMQGISSLGRGQQRGGQD